MAVPYRTGSTSSPDQLRALRTGTGDRDAHMLAPSNIKFSAAPSPKLHRIVAAPSVMSAARR